MEQKLFDKQQVARMVNRSTLTISRWQKEGLIKPQCKIKGKTYYSADAVQELVNIDIQESGPHLVSADGSKNPVVNKHKLSILKDIERLSAKDRLSTVSELVTFLMGEVRKISNEL